MEKDMVTLNKNSGGGYRYLGQTDIMLSPLGFGCAAAWAKAIMGRPMISDDEAKALFEKAYEYGIRYYDTGFNYGFAEERIGKILRSSTHVKRENIIISTKFGEELSHGKWRMNWSPEWMKKSVSISMERMGIDYLDMLMLHGGSISVITPQLLSALRELKSSGTIRAIGINTFSTDVIKWVAKEKCFDFVMLDYNILRQDREQLIKTLYESGVGVIAGAPLAESLYSNRIFKIKKSKDLWYLARAFANFRGQLIKGRKFTFINDIEGMSGSQIALKYVIDNPYITSAVFGTTTMTHLEENVRAQDIKIPESILQRIKTTR